MNPAPVRQRLKKYLTPRVEDYLVYQSQGTARKEAPEFGTLHTSQDEYPGYRFAFAFPKDDQGLLDTWVYAKPPQQQDTYNWEWTEADIGGTKFSAVKRTYLILRSEFNSSTPVQGTTMPNIPASQFAGTYRLAERTQQEIGDEELSKIFVLDVHVYAKTVSLTNVTLSPENGRAKFATSIWYCRGDTVAGQPIETLAADRDNTYWGQQSDAAGTFRELTSVSENWFVVTESTSVAGDGAPNGPSNPARNRTKIYPTPSVLDYFVREVGTDPTNLAYGTAHYDSATYPNHVLSYKRPIGSSGLEYEFFYTAPRANQHAYNFVITSGDVLVRTYVFPRANYLAATEDVAVPTVGTADPATRHAAYGYTHFTVERTGDQELDGVFVVEQRFYQKIEKVREFNDDELDRTVRETITFVAKGATTPTEGPGYEVSRDRQHTQYDVITTQRLLPNSGDTTSGGNLVYPVEMETIPTMVNKNLPPVLKAVNLVSIYAYAYSAGAPAAYDEDFYFDPIIQYPFPGPYPGRIRRFLTDDPQSIVAQFPIQTWVEVADTIPLVAGWWLASPDGNSAKALAKQITLPPTVHPQIPIGGIETLSIVQSKTTLPMTPGFANFSAIKQLVVDVSPKKTRMNLYIVEVYEGNITGAYGGAQSAFDDPGGSNGAGDGVIDTTPTPEVYTGSISSTNSIITGTATYGAAIVASYNGTEIGKVMSDAQGNYSIPLNTPYFTDPVEIEVKARKGGALSGALIIMARDLAPGTPTASVSEDLVTVSGNAQSGSTVTIGMAVQHQVETATVAGTITADGQAKLVLTTSLITSSPITVLVDVVNGNSASAVAGLFRAAMTSRAAINDVFAVSGSGTSVVLTTRADVYDDPTLNMATDNETSTGLTPAPTSVDTTQGLAPVTVVSNGTYSYDFDPPLPNGTVLSVTASDLGGTSPSVTVTASATPPLIGNSPPPAFDTGSYTDIVGNVQVYSGGYVTPSVGEVTIRAYYGSEVLQSATNDVTGNFVLTLTDPRYRGEAITLIASLTADNTVKSPSVDVSAPDLELPIPVYEESSGEYVGIAPDPASYAPAELYKLVVRYEPTSEEVEFDIFPENNTFAFDFDDFTGNLGNQNGERYEVFYRFDLDPGAGTYFVDGEPSYINSPVVPLPGAAIGSFPPPAFFPVGQRWDQNWPGALYTGSSTPPEGTWVNARARSNTTTGASGIYGETMPFPANKTLAVALSNPDPGVTIEIVFPGQPIASIGPEVYTGPYYMGTVSFPFQWRTVGQSLSATYFPGGLQAPVAGWYQNAPMYLRSDAKNAQPTRMTIIVRHPDGRESTTSWDKNDSYPWSDPIYNYNFT